MVIAEYKGVKYGIQWSNPSVTKLVRADGTGFCVPTKYLDLIPERETPRETLHIISETGALREIGTPELTIPSYLNKCADAVRKGYCSRTVAPTTVQRPKQYRCELVSINGTRLDGECHLPAGKCFALETWQAIMECVRNPTENKMPVDDFFS